jgi:hypothetical protein
MASNINWVGIVVLYLGGGFILGQGLIIATNWRGYGRTYYDVYFVDFFGYYRRRGFPFFQRWQGWSGVLFGSFFLTVITVSFLKR